MEAKPGNYALILRSSNHTNIQIGKLGKLKLQVGFYVYIGSAFGPGGLPARIEHHKHISQKPHWHIDYLCPFTKLKDIWFTYDSQQREHQWAEILKISLGGFIPLEGFGSSDCNCVSHLFYFKIKPSLKKFQKITRKSNPKHSIIMSLKINNP